MSEARTLSKWESTCLEALPDFYYSSVLAALFDRGMKRPPVGLDVQFTLGEAGLPAESSFTHTAFLALFINQARIDWDLLGLEGMSANATPAPLRFAYSDVDEMEGALSAGFTLRDDCTPLEWLISSQLIAGAVNTVAEKTVDVLRPVKKDPKETDVVHLEAQLPLDPLFSAWLMRRPTLDPSEISSPTAPEVSR